MNRIYLFGSFFGAKNPNEGTVAEMRGYEGWCSSKESLLPIVTPKNVLVAAVF